MRAILNQLCSGLYVLQNVIQAMFGVSDITVSATNGDKIVLKDVADGKRKRDIISTLVVSKSPGNNRKS